VQPNWQHPLAAQAYAEVKAMCRERNISPSRKGISEAVALRLRQLIEASSTQQRSTQQ
jgi:hypothetical protein